VYVITEEGKRVAAENPQLIDREFLMRFPKFVSFMSTESKPGQPVTDGQTKLTSAKTPEEEIDSAYEVLHAALKKDVLSRVKQMDPFRFEQLVLDLLLAMGYGGSREEAAQVTKRSGDEGIDGVINEDRLGLDVIYLQAKRWQNTVGRKEVQSFVGALAGQKADKGIFITTSDYAETAINFVGTIKSKVILINGDRLADLMIHHNIGVSKSHAYEVKQVDTDYFEES
jgi:restriction system protein